MTPILFQKMQSDDSSARSPDVEENSSYPTGRFVFLLMMIMIDDDDDDVVDDDDNDNDGSAADSHQTKSHLWVGFCQ